RDDQTTLTPRHDFLRAISIPSIDADDIPVAIHLGKRPTSLGFEPADWQRRQARLRHTQGRGQFGSTFCRQSASVSFRTGFPVDGLAVVAGLRPGLTLL